MSGGFKGTAYVGIIGLERLGNPTINAVLLSQSLSFTTPGRANAVGGVLGAGLQYRAMPNVKLFVTGEAVAMSDKSDSFAATGGAEFSFSSDRGKFPTPPLRGGREVSDSDDEVG